MVLTNAMKLNSFLSEYIENIRKINTTRNYTLYIKSTYIITAIERKKTSKYGMTKIILPTSL